MNIIEFTILCHAIFASPFLMPRKPISCRGEDGGSIDLPKDAAERFKNAAAVLRARDIEDRKDYKERRRKQAADAKAKRKATEAGEAEGSAVILGPGLGFPSAQGKPCFP